MASSVERPGTPASHLGASTQRVDQARQTVTRTTVTPSPGAESPQLPNPPARQSMLGRLRKSQHGELTTAREPYAGASALRMILAVLTSALWLLTIAGAILILLLWQQDRTSGVLSSQLDRTWDLVDALREVERWVAFAAIPIATAWIALAAVNVHRATGKRRNAIVAAASLPAGLFGVWLVGSQIVAKADDWVGEAAGLVLQATLLAIPLLALERVAHAAEARHQPLRASYVIGVVYLAQLQFLGGLSTVDQTSEPDRWGRLGAYLVIGGLLQVLGALSVNEAARAIEEGTDNRFQLRQRFGESLLAAIEQPGQRVNRLA